MFASKEVWIRTTATLVSLFQVNWKLKFEHLSRALKLLLVAKRKCRGCQTRSSNFSYVDQTRNFLCFLIILQNYRTVSKFIRFNHQTPWATTVEGPTVVAHDGLTNGRGSNSAGRPAAVGHGNRVVQLPCATTAGRLPLSKSKISPEMS
jgi:hypothetical protein